ncbi:MAG: ergothioneine biosynthesis protein EgtB [Thiohalocapsa sp.]
MPSAPRYVSPRSESASIGTSGVNADRQSEPTAGAERADLIADYRRVRALSEQLCEPLAVEDYMLQTRVETSPPKWHLAHVSWFYETFLLKPYLPGYRVFHARFDYLFNSYYEQTGAGYWPRPERGLLSRPTVAEVYAYRRHVDEAMERLIDVASEADWPVIAGRLAIGLNHEQQHQELLVTDIKFNLAYNPLCPAYRPDLPVNDTTEPARLDYARVDGGIVHIGAGDLAFGYDNEYPRHRALLEPYRLANRLVTNGEYLAFVDDGGYRNPALWLSDGWGRIQHDGWQAPLYWRRVDGAWHELTLAGLRPLNPAEPVCHVSYFEADAFARWADRRLPTEAEWEHAAADRPVVGNFVDDARLHPAPVPASAAADQLQQLFGDCWEWTASAYLPYPGYRAAKGALGEYNGKFMNGQMVLRGGSCATSRDHARASYRNFFYPHERWQFKGIRLAEDDR